jgi:hypothetical protein
VTLSQKDKVQVITAGFTTASITPGTSRTMMFSGAVRLKLADGEMVAKGGSLSTDEDGAGQFSSEELQFIRSSPR